nr:MAG TPA: hypothetical protein [Caudoviricetes sp.]DAU00700.1 MAG TPA: hypothetical protein [Caudoviricetes sp.]
MHVMRPGFFRYRPARIPADRQAGSPERCTACPERPTEYA